MHNDIIQYFLLGLTLAATPGAVLTESTRRAILDIKTVINFTIGNFVGLAIVVLISYIGVALLIQNIVLQKILYAIGGIILIVLGVQAIFHKPQYHVVHKKAKRHMNKRYAAFLTGAILSVGNPIRFLFWASFVGGLAFKSIDGFEAALYGLIVFIGMVVFYIFLLILLSLLGRHLKNVHLSFFSKLIGMILVMYGLVMIDRLVRL